MRKNGINRALRPIDGGVCAPEGFMANAVSCGIREEGGLDFAMIYTPRRCAVACTYASGKTQGAPVKVSKKNMRNGYARVILANGGVANCMQEGGEALALKVCDLLFPRSIERTEIVIASTGKIGKPIDVFPFAKGIEPLFQGLASSHEQSLKAAEAIRTEDASPKQLSFSFDLGDYPCKIGAIFKGGPQISPNMATFLVFLTTDVNITTPMLQKALTAEVKETLNMLNLDGVQSPNDTVCILANGRAGNYRIDCADTEYKKFTYALRAVLTEIAYATVREGGARLFICRVQGAPSKEAARAMAKALSSLPKLKKGLREGRCAIEDVLFTALAALDTVKGAKAIEVTNATVRLRAAEEELLLYEEDGDALATEASVRRLMASGEAELILDLKKGNYSAASFTRT